MRIVHALAPGPVGGAEQVVADLTLALRKAGVECHLAAVLDEGDRDHPFLTLVSSEVAIHPLFVPHRAYGYEYRELRKLFQSLGPGVVHTHGYRANVVAAAAARRLDLPVVSTAHGFTGRSLKMRLFQALERWSFRRADALVAVSRPLGNRLLRMGAPSARIHVIGNARSAPAEPMARDDARAELGVGPDDFVVGWVGRLGWEKGPDVMVDAARILTTNGVIRNLRITMLGGGESLESLKQRSRASGCEGSVSWLGQVQNAARLFRAFDAMVMSSRSEGTPIVALEAIALDVPLVATDVGGVVDLTGREAAIIVPPEDPTALAEAVVDVYLNPEGAVRRVRLAKERIEAHASIERWAEAHIDVYEPLHYSGVGTGREIKPD